MSDKLEVTIRINFSPYSTALNTGFETFSEPKIAVFEQKMIAFKKEDSVLKRSNKIRRGVENRLSNVILERSERTILICPGCSIPNAVNNQNHLTP